MRIRVLIGALAALFALSSVPAYAVTYAVGNGPGSVIARPCGSGATAVGTICTGSGVPSQNCSVGALYIRTDGALGTGLYECSATNTWSAIDFTGTATNANNIAITSDTSTSASMCPTWVTTNTGNLPAKVSCSKFFFNPAAGVSGGLTISNDDVSSIFISTAEVNASDRNWAIRNRYGANSTLEIDASAAQGGSPTVLKWSLDGITGNMTAVGTVTAQTVHPTCTSSTIIPCKFTWTCTMSSGACTTTQSVPASGTCVVTPTVSPELSSTNVVSTWVTLATTTLTIHVADMLGTSSAAFSGNGECL